MRAAGAAAAELVGCWPNRSASASRLTAQKQRDDDAPGPQPADLTTGVGGLLDLGEGGGHDVDGSR